MRVRKRKEVAIEVKNVSKRFKSEGEEVQALRNVSLTVKKGEIFALLGPNGAGKTTLLDIILTITIPDEGEVRIFGKNPFKEKEVLNRVNFVPSERIYSHLTVEQVLTFYAMLYGRSRKAVESVIKRLKLDEIRKRETIELSTGEATKLSIAKALLNEPELLILDEPMAGLDPRAKREIRTLLKGLNKRGVTILFASHDMLEVERLATKIALISNGKLLGVFRKRAIVSKYGSVENYWLKVAR